jgi:hypothetical protein
MFILVVLELCDVILGIFEALTTWGARVLREEG